MTDLAISVVGLRKEFGAKVAVSNLNLQVKQGEVFGFLGSNGAGKTTSMKMLLGLVHPTRGSGTLLGQPLGDIATRAKIGFLPEHFRWHDWLTAVQFLHMHGKLYNMSRAKREATIPDLLQLVGLIGHEHKRLRHYSKGMLQRVGLAQALLNDPCLVFLDEPTSGLDPLGRRLVRDVIAGLREEGTAVFLNSHLLSEVEKSCDRVAFIREGEVVEVIDLHEESERVELTVRVGQPDEAFLVQLGQMGENVREGVNGRFHLTIDSRQTVPQMAEWLVQNNYTLYELTPTTLSLEDRFLQIIEQ